MNTIKDKCWVCEESEPSLVKQGSLRSDISVESFQITDANYGNTLDTYRCRNFTLDFKPSRIGWLVYSGNTNVKFVLARLLGWKWWHYRVAHIGYFEKSILSHLLNRAGLTPVQ